MMTIDDEGEEGVWLIMMTSPQKLKFLVIF